MTKQVLSALLFVLVAFKVNADTPFADQIANCNAKFPDYTTLEVESFANGCSYFCKFDSWAGNFALADSGTKCGDEEECFNGGCYRTDSIDNCPGEKSDLDYMFESLCTVQCKNNLTGTHSYNKPDTTSCGQSMECLSGICTNSTLIQKCSVQPNTVYALMSTVNCDIYCFDPDFKSTNVVADDGTPCGELNENVCIQGECSPP